MKPAGLRRSALAVLGAACVSAIVLVLVLVFRNDSDAPPTSALGATRVATIEPLPTPLPETWLASLAGIDAAARPELIACRDRNRDLRLDAGDGVAGVDIALIDGEACAGDGVRADYYADATDRIAGVCREGGRALLVVGIASAGSDLLAPREGESLGLLPIINDIRLRADSELGITSWLIMSTAAIFGAEQPQTSMEQWLAREIGVRMEAAPCLRAVLIGHSHGGATVTSVTATLDAAYGRRLLGVLIDRTTALYDRPATEMPSRTPILNFFQLNEGWHGVPLDAPNVTNYDESGRRAPVAPSDGGGPTLALVSHKTLDDAPEVQSRAVGEILAWAAR